jgi:hypothetical protein
VIEIWLLRPTGPSVFKSLFYSNNNNKKKKKKKAKIHKAQSRIRYQAKATTLPIQETSISISLVLRNPIRRRRRRCGFIGGLMENCGADEIAKEITMSYNQNCGVLILMVE